MSRFKKLLHRIRELEPADDRVKLLKGFAEQLWYVWRRRKHRGNCGKGNCGIENKRWLKQRLFEKLMKHCESLGHKELVNG